MNCFSAVMRIKVCLIFCNSVSHLKGNELVDCSHTYFVYLSSSVNLATGRLSPYYGVLSLTLSSRPVVSNGCGVESDSSGSIVGIRCERLRRYIPPPTTTS